MRDKILGLMHLAERAGAMRGGEDIVLESIRKKKARLVLIATDASENTKKKYHDKCAYYRVPVYEYGTKSDFGHSGMALEDRNFSEEIIRLLGGGK